MKELYYNFERMYGVFWDEQKSRHVIEVECGQIGLYPVIVPLTAEEVAGFQKDPDYLTDLAFRICREPEQFKRTRGWCTYSR